MARDESSLEKDKAALRAMVSMGCDREMAAKAVGWSMTELREALRDDPHYARTLLRAEGQSEFQRMRVLHEATNDQKNWRAATWWLERRAERRYGRRKSRNVTTEEIQDFIDELVELVFAEVTREHDRERLVTSLAALAYGWEYDVSGPSPDFLLPAIPVDALREEPLE
jgi:hypothetical protein